MQFHHVVRNSVRKSARKSARNFLILISALVFTSACTTSGLQTGTTTKISAEPTMGMLVSAEWLSEHLDDPDLVVLDTTVLVEPNEEGGVRSVNGQANYDAGHIPSAGFADLLGDLSDRDNPLEFTMPTPEQFSAAMGALGVGDDSRVVLYATNYPVWPARLWWMLRWAGFDEVALLDGGLKAWTDGDRPVSTDPVNRPAKQFTLKLRPELIADRDQVFASIDNSNVSLIDAMPDAHYRGDFAMYGRPGHIPGATNLPAFDLLDETGHFRSFDELDMMQDGDRNGRVITYCGGGVAASAVAFSMNRLGFSDVAVYMGSLQEWTANPANPMSLDSP